LLNVRDLTLKSTVRYTRSELGKTGYGEVVLALDVADRLQDIRVESGL
jgi:hypothetical protein